MMRRLAERVKDQAGVAMVTVLLIGAALTALSSTAAFITIEELRSGTNDKKAVAALAYAEAGIDRFMSYLKSGLVTYGDLNAAGCSEPALALPVGQVQSGSYEASLTVYDPNPPSGDPDDRFPIAPTSGACATRPETPHLGQHEEDQSFFVITSIGRHPEATRTVRQVIALELIKLPVGIYAQSINMQSAQHPFYTVSMVSETEITHRRSISFIGEDPFYLVKDFFPGVTGRDPEDPVPAAAHAAVQTYLFQSRDPEFEFATKQCAGNGTKDGGVASQSLWDSDGSSGSGAITSGCPGWAGGAEWPHSSKFSPGQLQDLIQAELSAQDHETLRAAGQQNGVYCSFPGTNTAETGGTKCFRQGVDQGAGVAYDTYVQDVLASGTNNFVVYLEFRSGAANKNSINKEFTVWGCDDTDPDKSKSVVVVIRNGGVNWTGTGGNMINGAMLMDGDFTAKGGFTFNGSLIVLGRLNINSSSQNFSVNDCWVNNMPGAFFRASPVQWAEVDR